MKLWAAVIFTIFCWVIVDGTSCAAEEAVPGEGIRVEDAQDNTQGQSIQSQDSEGKSINQETEARVEPVEEAEVQKEQVSEEETHPDAAQEGESREHPVQQEDIKVEKAQKEMPKNDEPRRDTAQRGNDQKQDLLDRIEELEKRINELSEESRARRKLEITEAEKQEKEKDVLEAVGREYTLDAKHSLGFDYTLSYNYSPSERFDSQLIVTEQSDHTIKHTISATYGMLDNLSTSTTIPFVYRYNKVGTDKEIDETDIGDISLGISYQPWGAKVGDVTKTFSLSVGLPTGRSPYKINPQTELSTGSGIFSVSAGGSFSVQIDPIVAFWNASYGYNFDATNLNYTLAEDYVLEEVNPGNSWSVGAGMAYGLSYKVSVNTSISYSYSYSSEYHYRNASSTVKSGDSVSATLGMGMGWKVSNKTTMSFSLGYGLTGTGFSFAVRVPFNFML